MLKIFAFVLLFAIPAIPAGPESSGAVITSNDVKDTIKNAKANPGAVPGTYDVTIRSMNVEGDHVGAAVIRRVQPEDKDALVHEKVTEIYEITEGSGTVELGGKLVGGKDFGGGSGPSAIGPSLRGTGIEGGHSQHVGPGDIVIIPAGTPHRFSALDGPITYLCFRVDPSKLTPLK
jgi:mannose-6-phosphate isomerase-like protein (cupin superfamily)